MKRAGLLTVVIGALALGALPGCASAPRPAAMQDVASVRSSPGSIEAARWAPQEHAQAELLWARAEKAYRAGDVAGAQILGEQALAGYDRAMTLARLVRAERRHADAGRRLEDTTKELQTLEQQRQALEVEARDLEMRARVARDAEPVRLSEASTPDREQARRRAALALASQARLLCVSAVLLDQKSAALDTLKSIRALESSSDKGDAGGVIDEARRLAAQCLSQLTSIRRPATTRKPTAANADALLAELSQSGGFFAFRDDRGVVVVLRSVFARDTVAQAAQQSLRRLGAIAKRYPDYPILAVLHGTSSSVSSRAAEALERALGEAGAARVTTEIASGTQPVVDPKLTGAAARNERVEIIFVSPTS